MKVFFQMPESQWQDFCTLVLSTDFKTEEPKITRFKNSPKGYQCGSFECDYPVDMYAVRYLMPNSAVILCSVEARGCA
jgi:hypothetical protein